MCLFVHYNGLRVETFSFFAYLFWKMMWTALDFKFYACNVNHPKFSIRKVINHKWLFFWKDSSGEKIFIYVICCGSCPKTYFSPRVFPWKKSKFFPLIRHLFLNWCDKLIWLLRRPTGPTHTYEKRFALSGKKFLTRTNRRWLKLLWSFRHTVERCVCNANVLPDWYKNNFSTILIKDVQSGFGIINVS